jgi:WD40 repeat protein
VIGSVGLRDGGKEIVTPADSGGMSRWDAQTGKFLGRILMKDGENRPAYRFGIVSSNGTMAFSHGDPTALGDLSTGEEVFSTPQLKQGSGTDRTAYLSSDLKWLVQNDSDAGQMFLVWDLVNRRMACKVEWTGERSYQAAALSQSGTRLVTLGQVRNKDSQIEQVVAVWNVKTGKKLSEFLIPNNENLIIKALTVVSDSEAVVLSDRAIFVGTQYVSQQQIWTINYERGVKGKEIDVLPSSWEAFSREPLVFSPDSKLFAAGVATSSSEKYGVRVYEWPSGRILHTFMGHRRPVTALLFSPDGKSLISASWDTTVVVWDLTTIRVVK